VLDYCFALLLVLERESRIAFNNLNDESGAIRSVLQFFESARKRRREVSVFELRFGMQ